MAARRKRKGKKKHSTRVSAHEIAEEILGLIQAAVYQPGDRLREQDIADRFGVSRGPVREALRILEAKTAIRIEPMRGATVIRMSDEETVVAVQMSGVLFGLAVRRAAELAEKEERALFFREAERLRALADKEDATPRAFFRATESLGLKITRAADSPKLETHLRDLRIGAPGIFGPLGFLTTESRRRAGDRWIEMTQAIRLGDAECAERIAIEIHEEACRNALAVGL